MFCYVNGAGDSGSGHPMAGILIDGTSNNVRVGPGTNLGGCAGGTVVGGAQLGQVLTATAFGVSLTSATPAALTSLSLPPGTYGCGGSVYTHPSGATQTLASAAVNATSATIPTSPGTAVDGSSQTVSKGLTLGVGVFNVTTPITVYANAAVTFSGGTLTADGSLACTRTH